MNKFYEQSVEALKKENLENLISQYQKSDSCLIDQVYKLYEVFDKIDKNNLDNLQRNLIIYRDNLISFTKMNTAFFYKYLNEENDRKRELIYTYVESSSLHISNLQNIYISSLTFDINQFHNNLLHTKTKESIKQGELLLIKAKGASKFALITFIIAFLLSLIPLTKDLFFTKSSEELIMYYSKSIDSLRINIQNLKEENMSQADILAKQNRTLILKLDSALKRTGVSKKSNNLPKSSSIKSTEK